MRHCSVLSHSLVGRLAAERPREGRRKKRKLTHNNTDALPSSTKLQMALIPRHLPLATLKGNPRPQAQIFPCFLFGGDIMLLRDSGVGGGGRGGEVEQN